MTQEQLAEQCGITVNSVGHYEGGRAVPKVDTLERIASATGKPLAWFFGGEDATQAPAAPAQPEEQAHGVEGRLARVEDALARQTAALEGIGAALQALAQRPPPNDIVAQELRRLRSDMQALRSEVNDLAAQDEEDGEGDCPGEETCSG